MQSNALRTVLLPVLAAGLMAGAAAAQDLPHMGVRLDVPVESPGIPAYMRLADYQWLPRNEQWTALVFYREPGCVPPDFNLLQFTHFPGPEGLGAFACPLVVEGYDLRFASLDPSLPPEFMRMFNRSPEQPVWFVDSTALSALLDRGYVYINEIEDLPSLVRGRAWQFDERLYPSISNPEPGLTMHARGRLETGALFELFWHNHPARGENHLELSIRPPSGGTAPVRGRRAACDIDPTLPPCQD
ncbi:MAG: hypothetical protein ACXIUZ_12750 [Lysobacteraceae bacterium]